ncbi:MAG TPA: helix-turn-helix transcriptional regulator [Thermoanaerobaculia bacterium]|jgi:transcriptional regulator with XRE-family HTH domain|nr:helix-turn-helix transcriptional regulator [Thermoanaerobaculia bacterium]
MPTVARFEFQEVGQQLLLAMKRMGLTQYELAKRSGVSRRQIGMAFKGANITLDTLEKISKVLRVHTIRMREVEISYASSVNSEALVRAGQVLDSIRDQAEQVKVLIGQEHAAAATPAAAPQSLGSRTLDLELMERAYDLVRAIAGASQKAS